MSKMTTKFITTFITNDSAGAPYYGQEVTPCSDWIDKFSSQHVVLFINVEVKKVWCEAINPDTMELIDTFTLAE